MCSGGSGHQWTRLHLILLAGANVCSAFGKTLSPSPAVFGLRQCQCAALLDQHLHQERMKDQQLLIRAAELFLPSCLFFSNSFVEPNLDWKETASALNNLHRCSSLGRHPPAHLRTASSVFTVLSECWSQWRHLALRCQLNICGGSSNSSRRCSSCCRRGSVFDADTR